MPNSELQKLWTDPLHPEADALDLSAKSVWTSTSRADRQFPVFQGLPWLFPEPTRALVEWRDRALQLLQFLESEVADLKSQISESSSATTRKRLTEIRRLKILHLEYVRRTLEPLKVQDRKRLIPGPDFYRLPLRQGLLGYAPNAVRDWSPSLFAGENERLLELISQQMLPEFSGKFRIAVLGCGAGRLAYDLAQLGHRVVGLDLNPLLLFAAQEFAFGGAARTSADFPVQALDPDRPGREVKLGGFPAASHDHLSFAFGDVYQLPLVTSSFDIVITPWLIDILPRRFSELVAEIARVLRPDGAWINAGSWRFDFRSESENLSLAEAEESAATFFRSLRTQRASTPYLHSPIDAHRREEILTCFTWQRNSSPPPTERPLADDRIEWIRDPQLSIPALPVFAAASATHLAMSELLREVDGRRSITDLAARLKERHGISDAEALIAVSAFFDRFMLDRRFRDFT